MLIDSELHPFAHQVPRPCVRRGRSLSCPSYFQVQSESAHRQKSTETMFARAGQQDTAGGKRGCSTDESTLVASLKFDLSTSIQLIPSLGVVFSLSADHGDDIFRLSSGQSVG